MPVRLGPNKRRQQYLALEHLFISLISCVQEADVQEIVTNLRGSFTLRLMNMGGRVEKITVAFIRKWGKQYVKYWKLLADLRDEGPEDTSHQLYCRKQRKILEETERLIADLQIGFITVEMREAIEEMLQHESLHASLLTFPE